MIAKIKNFFTETTTEMKKVSWSTKEELFGATAVVLASTVILAIFIGIVDFVLAGAIKLALR